MTDNTKKRKSPSTGNSAPAAKRPRFPPRPSRNIAATPSSTAYPNGQVNVAQFMRAHENEIRSLENAMKSARKGLSRRAFQLVPRDLRRRTGSHNPQRVPRRLRPQARREAKDDNTPIKKGKSGSGVGKGAKGWLRKEDIKKRNRTKDKRQKVTVRPTEGEHSRHNDSSGGRKSAPTDSTAPPKKRKNFAALAAPPTPASRFRRRQVHKTWLPSHLFHTKRATMTPPKEPLWRFAIPLSPAVKTYRTTHRAATERGAIAWDMSYMATIGLEAAEESITGLLKALQFAKGDEGFLWSMRGRGKKWRDGSRIWEGWIHEREGTLPKPIAQVAVIWSVQRPGSNKRKAFIRVHPSAFLRLWNVVIRAANVQKPSVIVDDLRFEIGSIEIMGPAAMETLCSVLTPTATETSDLPSDVPRAIWPRLASVTRPGELPQNALVAFNISDPRLRHPPKTASVLDDAEDKLLGTLTEWPVDRTQTTPSIFDRTARLASGRLLSSQQSINRRKGAVAVPGQYPDLRPTDPQIPMLTYVSKNSNTLTVLLPWKCVKSVWKCLMQYPCSSGGNPRFGGLQERRQVDFERSMPSFPFDFPGTDAGWEWELKEREARKHEWTKRPRGKRIEWTSIPLGDGRKGEVGDPWACDWTRLLPESHGNLDEEAQILASPFRYLASAQAEGILASRSEATSQEFLDIPHLFTVKVSMVQRGMPTDCARVYKFPSKKPELQKKWLSLYESSKSKNPPGKSAKKPLSHPNTTQALAASLLESPKAGDDEYPIVPDEEDLIGFVTTGNFNLAEGRPTAIANLVLQRVVALEDGGVLKTDSRYDGKRLCIVREAGQTLGRLAMWDVV
ncbi:ribonucleases P/MRP protein subunit POP1-domain-containing protein [Lophiotrema nucula]|uniref:Ribonucleases P/MRP protein subunit POP1-domain-containing protein n=1 Tax=Lophiotrema nucula TaxID=690887 RepID=A0A6A5ZAQ8_9PLEO|nr:ribonucleases P/MRP protein subunit POP1-domain-containing protein [Lophiotrema nucula]